MLLASMLLADGCMSPGRGVPVARISNEARLVYAYKPEGEPFLVDSPPITFIALIPEGYQISTELPASQWSKAIAAWLTSWETEARQLALIANASEASSEVDARQGSAEASAGARAHSQHAGEASNIHDAEIRSSDASSTLVTNTQTADIHVQDASAAQLADEAASWAAWQSDRPTVTKQVDRANVMAGDTLCYTVEISNATPMDLAFVAVYDQLDPRLEVDSDDVSIRPFQHADIALTDGELRIALPSGLDRGRTIRIRIPATLGRPPMVPSLATND